MCDILFIYQQSLSQFKHLVTLNEISSRIVSYETKYSLLPEGWTRVQIWYVEFGRRCPWSTCRGRKKRKHILFTYVARQNAEWPCNERIRFRKVIVHFQWPVVHSGIVAWYALLKYLLPFIRVFSARYSHLVHFSRVFPDLSGARRNTAKRCVIFRITSVYVEYLFMSYFGR